MINKLVKLYLTKDEVKYSLSELSDLMDLSLPNMFQLSHTLIQKGILVNSGIKILFPKVAGKMVSTEVQAFIIDKMQLDRYLFDELSEGKILFDRSHIYMNRWDLKTTTKLEKLNKQ